MTPCPILLRTKPAGLYVGSIVILERFIKAGWIRPQINEHKLKFWALWDLTDCVKRMGQETLPR